MIDLYTFLPDITLIIALINFVNYWATLSCSKCVERQSFFNGSKKLLNHTLAFRSNHINFMISHNAAQNRGEMITPRSNDRGIEWTSFYGANDTV